MLLTDELGWSLLCLFVCFRCDDEMEAAGTFLSRYTDGGA